MNLQQLRYLCAVVETKFNVSKAAERLFTSQPGISKQIQLLEGELGVLLLIRKGNRIIGLTPPGEEVYAVAQRMLSDARNLKKIGEEFSAKNEGSLVIATTHLHAGYVLPKIIKKFSEIYPHVSVSLKQSDPIQIANWICSGEADVGISATFDDSPEELILFPYANIDRSILVPEEHPLTKVKKITIEQIAQYPIISLDSSFAGGSGIKQAFESQDLKPNFVLSATDTDVIKTYVEIGLGIAIVPAMSYDKIRDVALTLIKVNDLFPPIPIYIQVRRGKYLRHFMEHFISMICPNWSGEFLNGALYNQK
jgi:LysR family cys regulon transcriptional activator